MQNDTAFTSLDISICRRWSDGDQSLGQLVRMFRRLEISRGTEGFGCGRQRGCLPRLRREEAFRYRCVEYRDRSGGW